MPILPINEIENKTFDYVVVGGGTAGLTLAVRLSEDASKSVLCLEAGGANLNDPAILRPASWGSHFSNDQYDWNHKTVAQKSANGIQYSWPRGKGLGGSSAINFMCWTRPPAKEIDDIERLGNPGWNWKNLDASMKKLEGYIAPTEEIAKKQGLKVETWNHGTSGTLHHSFPGHFVGADKAVQDALLNSGFKHAKDPLGGDPAGVYFSTQSVDSKTYTRSYSASAFYIPAQNRKNLTVTVDALVSRVVTEQVSGKAKATSVEFLNGDKTYSVKVGREVILSAGALKSPQILELSGIGKKDVLESVKIPVVVDLPGVGENLQEHVYIPLSFELDDDVPFDTVDLLRDAEAVAKHLKLHDEQKGLFTAGIMGFSFGPLQLHSKRADEIHQAQIKKIEANKDKYPPGLYEQYQIQVQRLKDGAPGCEIVNVPGFLSFPNPPKPNKKYFSLLPAMNHQFSRGWTHVISKDPKIDPAYDPAYFSEDIDLQTFLECVKFVRSLAKIAPFSDMVVAEANPGPNCTTDEQLTEWLKSYMATTYHTAATCSMLPREKNGVVDPNLVVYGTSNIRVCDLSILPLHFASHPQAAIYTFAARAADIIMGKA
ncbi:GMC oxidoreductase [Peniophora sp. CONT]|nr:GMC oxidoreductase [Peniophora sp. CONT]